MQLHATCIIDTRAGIPFLEHCIPPGRTSVPEIFFNDHLIGGSDDLQKLEDEGKLDHLLKECLEAPDPDFPPPCRKPEGTEFLKVWGTWCGAYYYVCGVIACHA